MSGAKAVDSADVPRYMRWRRVARREAPAGKRDAEGSLTDRDLYEELAMLMAKQPVLYANNSRVLVSRLRFQLLAMWVIAVALPGICLYTGLVTVESFRAIHNSVSGTAFASFLGLITMRRINSFPGTRSYSYILPSLAAAYGLTLALFFGLRFVYSRSVFSASFVLAVFVGFALAYLMQRLVKPLVYIVPGGDASSLCAIDQANWVTLAEPVVPCDPHAMIAADFRYDHSDEWERMLAGAAIEGRVVYHSKLLRESLTGLVTMEHLSENSFGSLLPNLTYRKIKRVVDFCASILVLPFVIPVILLVSLAIWIDSRGHIFFRQERVGYHGEIFEMVKFRTMHPRPVLLDEAAARQDAMTREGDNRITRVGRFLRRSRLDELPQIVNILRGEMSWIGPRPEAVPLSRWYEGEIPFYSYRHIVRPGITGWAQVHQGHVTDLEAINKKLSYDFYYVKYFSGWLDMVIALRTVSTVLRGFGAR